MERRPNGVQAWIVVTILLAVANPAAQANPNAKQAFKITKHYTGWTAFGWGAAAFLGCDGPCAGIAIVHAGYSLAAATAEDFSDPPPTLPTINLLAQGPWDFPNLDGFGSAMPIISGPPGTIINIHGGIFDFVPTDNDVKFGATSAMVANIPTATQDMLMTFVPDLVPGLYPVTVTNSVGISSPVMFEVLPPVPVPPDSQAFLENVAARFRQDLLTTRAMFTAYASEVSDAGIDFNSVMADIDDGLALFDSFGSDIQLLSQAERDQAAQFFAAALVKDYRFHEFDGVVPEPATLVLLMCGFLGWLVRCRRA